jgi:hypothetical protein
MNRRVKILLVSNLLWRHLFSRDDNKWKSHVVMEGFPEDGRVVGAEFDFTYDRVALKIESATFPELRDGEAAPYFGIKVTNYHPEQPVQIGN